MKSATRRPTGRFTVGHEGTSRPRVGSLACLGLAGLVVALLVVLVGAPLAGAHPGDLAWQRIYNGSGNGFDAYNALVAAPAGGVYAGGSTTVATGSDFLIARYSAAGQLRFRRTWDDPSGGSDGIAAEARGPAGGLAVAGFASDGTTEVVATGRYSASGRRLWVRLYGEAGATDQYAQQVAVDKAGDVYAAGTRFTSTTGADILLLKYSRSGVVRWVRHYAGAGGDFLTGIALDRAGDVYLTGFTDAATGSDALTLKYSPTGKRRWTRLYNGPGDGDDAGDAIAVTAGGTAYVAGNATGVSTGSDAVILKYTSNGGLRWSRFQTSPGVFNDSYETIALTSNGDVVAAGSEFRPATANDVLVARLSPAGHTRWVRVYNDPGNLAEGTNFMAIAPTGAISVEGFIENTATGSDWLTLDYGKGGRLLWTRSYTSAGSATDIAGAIVASGTGVYVAGQLDDAGNYDAAVVKYVP